MYTKQNKFDTSKYKYQVLRYNNLMKRTEMLSSADLIPFLVLLLLKKKVF